MAYPFAVYFARDRVSARDFVLAALMLVVFRVLTARSAMARAWRLPLLVMALVLLVSTFLDAEIAAKAYPTLMSLAAALVFWWSLRHPPSLIEGFARLHHVDLPPTAVSYCRNVTTIWAFWLAGNAAISASLAVWGSLGAWTLWTGLVSYVIMGALFVGEIAFRYLISDYRADR
ncbi:MAG TPA: hypothetical protein VF920_17245, partial [Dongiaceae bacterium]